MAAGADLSGRVRETWSKLNTHWRGEAADAFYRSYLLQMQESAERFDSACIDLDSATAVLERELAGIERSLNL